MDSHLSNTSSNLNLPSNLRLAASGGREKLLKYKVFASKNQFYILGTFSCHFSGSLTCSLPSVLHPSLRAEWFKTTAPKTGSDDDKARAQKNAVEQAKSLFLHVAQTYYEHPLPSETNSTTANEGTPSQIQSDADGWLAGICDFETSIPTPVPRSKDLLKEETQRYLQFEGGRGELENPLAWWKVRGGFLMIVQLN
jgi:hypothetical protein